MSGASIDPGLIARIEGMPHGRKRSALVELKDVATRLVDGVGDDATRTTVRDTFTTLVETAAADDADTPRLHEAGERLIELAKPVGHLATPVAKAVGDVLTASGSIL
jgi:hypothetical protein